MMSAKYFEYYTIILRGAVFSWTHCTLYNGRALDGPAVRRTGLENKTANNCTADVDTRQRVRQSGGGAGDGGGGGHRDGDHLVEDHGGRFVEVEDVELVVVRAVGRLADVRVARLRSDVDSYHRVDVEPGQLLSLDDRHAHLPSTHVTPAVTPSTSPQLNTTESALRSSELN